MLTVLTNWQLPTKPSEEALNEADNAIEHAKEQ
jgi:hypothetical protein